MKDAPAWGTAPMIGIVLARLVELHARALRVDAARRAQRMARLVDLIVRDKR